MTNELMKLADAYAIECRAEDCEATASARAALQSAIEAKLDAAQAQEPVAVVGCDDYTNHPNIGTCATLENPLPTGTKLYASPVVQQPSDEFAKAYWKACDSSQPFDWMQAALAAQQVLKTTRPAIGGQQP